MQMPGRTRQNLVGRTLPLTECLGGGQDMIRGYVAIAKVMYRGWMCCSAGPSETELAAHQPPASLERLRPKRSTRPSPSGRFPR